MTQFASPAPQWSETSASAGVLSRLVPVLDATSGHWVLKDIPAAPSGAFVVEPTSGHTVIDDTTIYGLNPILLPNGIVVVD